MGVTNAGTKPAGVRPAGVSRLPGARRAHGLGRAIGSLAILVAASIVVGLVLSRGVGTPIRIVFGAIAVASLAQITLSLFAHLRAGGRASRRASHDVLDVAVLVPVYNEDPRALARCLRSFLEQTRLPQSIAVVDDGSTETDYAEVRDAFLRDAAAFGVSAHWTRTPNQGKRHAQIEGVRMVPFADVYVTVDSDSILDRRALRNGLESFEDPRVQSVAAVILTTNYRQSLLARWMDLYCLGLQLFERSAFSTVSSVLVNSGGCALYRGDVIRDNIDVYLNERIVGRPVQFSDDSMLTLFALRRGRAVQREDCFAFTLMPTTLDHHVRQQLRWMRGSFIRSIWRMRFLPMRRAAYWLHLVKWLLYAAATATLVQLLIDGTLFHWRAVVSGLVASSALYAVTVLRYSLVIRTDQSAGQRWLTLATAPIAALWNFTVLKALRWYAIATFYRTGWGTRASVEVRDTVGA